MNIIFDAIIFEFNLFLNCNWSVSKKYIYVFKIEFCINLKGYPWWKHSGYDVNQQVSIST